MKFQPTKDRIPNQDRPGYSGVFHESSKWNPEGMWADRVKRQVDKTDLGEHKGWTPAKEPGKWLHPRRSMRHEEEEEWGTAWENPDFNESPSPVRQPGKFSKEVVAKKAPKEKETPKKEEPKKEEPKEDPPENEATEPGESQPNIEVEEVVAADPYQNPQYVPAAEAGSEPAEEPEPQQQPALSAGASASFG